MKTLLWSFLQEKKKNKVNILKINIIIYDMYACACIGCTIYALYIYVFYIFLLNSHHLYANLSDHLISDI